jgi:hypothetical protein
MNNDRNELLSLCQVRKGSSIPVRMSGRTMDVAIHNRMPDILQNDQIEHWLDPTASDPSVKAAV